MGVKFRFSKKGTARRPQESAPENHLLKDEGKKCSKIKKAQPISVIKTWNSEWFSARLYIYVTVLKENTRLSAKYKSSGGNPYLMTIWRNSPNTLLGSTVGLSFQNLRSIARNIEKSKENQKRLNHNCKVQTSSKSLCIERWRLCIKAWMLNSWIKVQNLLWNKLIRFIHIGERIINGPEKF